MPDSACAGITAGLECCTVDRAVNPRLRENPPHHPPFPQKHSAIPAKTLRHSREGGNPQFPRNCGNSTSHYPNTQKKHSAIPAKTYSAIPAKTLRHSREGGNPQFPRMREFNVPLPQHPGKTLRHSRKNLLRHSRKNTPSFPRKSHPITKKPTPSFPRRRESTIPAHAGIQRPITPTPRKNTPPFPQKPTPPFPQKHSVIPAKTLRHSREGGNPQFPRTREFNVPLPQHPGKTLRHSRKNTPPFPRKPKKHSVIPAKAGIHNSRARGNSTSHYPNTQKKTLRHSRENLLRHSRKNLLRHSRKNSVIPAKTLRHSREGGNPQFPRTREFNVPLPQHPGKTLRHSRENTPPFPQKHSAIPAKTTPPFPQKHSVIPAKAGIHNSRARGNSTSHYPNTQKKTLRHFRENLLRPSFPRSHVGTSPGSHGDLNLPAYPFKLLDKCDNSLQNALLFALVLRVKRAHARERII